MPVVLDTDPGIGRGLDADDALALLLILASPELELKGVSTVFGNVDIWRATETALAVLDAAGRNDVPVAMGMSGPLSGVMHEVSIIEHGNQAERIGAVNRDQVLARRASEHGVDLILRAARDNPGRLTVIAIGPLTNLAVAILKEPALRDQIRAVSIMGGAFGTDPMYGRGNITPVAEYNIWHDPLAAKIVMESKIPVVMAPLDITNPNTGTVLWEDDLLELVKKESRFTQFLYQACRTYIDEPKFEWKAERKGCIMYDAVAVTAIIDRTMFDIQAVPVWVETRGEYTQGQTIMGRLDTATKGEPDNLIDVCIGVDGHRFSDLLVSRLRSLAESLQRA